MLKHTHTLIWRIYWPLTGLGIMHGASLPLFKMISKWFRAMGMTIFISNTMELLVLFSS